MIKERYSTIAVMTDQVRVWARVSHDISPERVVLGKNEEIRLPLSFFATTAAIQPTILLAENLDDCYLIYEMARALARSIGLGSVKTTFDNRPGGGSTTHQVAEDLLNLMNRLLIAVVDSDKETPGGAIGNTARDTRKVFHDLSPEIGQLVIVRGRDLENLLPDAFYRDNFIHHVDHGQSAAFITALESAGCGLARLHIDIEQGLTLNVLLREAGVPNDFENVWGKVVIAVSGQQLPASQGCVACALAGYCANPAACGCVLTRGNSMDLLSIGAEAWRRNGREFWRTLPHCIESAFMEVARAAFDWGCASSLQPT